MRETAASAVDVTETQMVPAVGVYFSAFPKRFITIWSEPNGVAADPDGFRVNRNGMRLKRPGFF
jgi:hypothetical protein